MNYIDKLNAILKASGWSQEQLARELETSHPTLNAWLNQRSQPRQKALLRIDSLFLEIVGTQSVDQTDLQRNKNLVAGLTISPITIVNDEQLLDRLTLYFTYHTNTIEGSTMTIGDVGDVIFDNKVLSNRTAIEQTEARNHQAALHWLLDQLALQDKKLIIDEDLVLGLHLRLMNGIISDAGQYRRHTVRIMGANVALANWQKIPDLMAQLTHSLDQKGDDLVAELAKSHAAFEQIHPFSDGNGRVGRLLLLAQALRASKFPPLVVKERKQAYYKYLEAAQTGDKHELLELFISQSIQACAQLLTGDSKMVKPPGLH